MKKVDETGDGNHQALGILIARGDPGWLDLLREVVDAEDRRREARGPKDDDLDVKTTSGRRR